MVSVGVGVRVGVFVDAGSGVEVGDGTGVSVSVGVTVEVNVGVGSGRKAPTTAENEKQVQKTTIVPMTNPLIIFNLLGIFFSILFPLYLDFLFRKRNHFINPDSFPSLRFIRRFAFLGALVIFVTSYTPAAFFNRRLALVNPR